MIRPIQKLWENKYADLRDYEVKIAIRKKEPIIVEYAGQRMTLTPERLRTKRNLFNKTPVKSKFNVGQEYLLYSYFWTPDPTLTEDQKLEQMSKDGVFG